MARERVAQSQAQPKKADSLERYERIYELRIAPTFGQRTFVSITCADIDAWVSKMPDEPAAAGTTGNRHSVLHPIMGYGAREMSLRLNNS